MENINFIDANTGELKHFISKKDLFITPAINNKVVFGHKSYFVKEVVYDFDQSSIIVKISIFS